MTLATGKSDRTRPLLDGTVKPDGIDLICITLDPHETFWRMIRYEEFDASEMSMSSYLMAKEAGKGLIAIPVFPSRAFRHSYIFCNVDSKINEPGDLVGKKVGVPEYQITAALWVRGMLQHGYDISPDKVKWFTEREERLPFTAPKRVHIERIPKGKDLDSMLVKGEIDALIEPTIPSSIAQKSPKVKRLFQDYKRVEQNYYKKTGYYPIMHTVVIR
jgi:4,5-dihydroxyphthalate decarboxylase